MIQDLLKFLPCDNMSLYMTAERLRAMSDYEYIELAFMLRKIIRESCYDTETGDISLRGFIIINSYDYEVLVLLSKLISQQPYESKEDVKAKVEV